MRFQPGIITPEQANWLNMMADKFDSLMGITLDYQGQPRMQSFHAGDFVNNRQPPNKRKITAKVTAGPDGNGHYTWTEVQQVAGQASSKYQPKPEGASGGPSVHPLVERNGNTITTDAIVEAELSHYSFAYDWVWVCDFTAESAGTGATSYFGYVEELGWELGGTGYKGQVAAGKLQTYDTQPNAYVDQTASMAVFIMSENFDLELNQRYPVILMQENMIAIDPNTFNPGQKDAYQIQTMLTQPKDDFVGAATPLQDYNLIRNADQVGDGVLEKANILATDTYVNVNKLPLKFATDNLNPGGSLSTGNSYRSFSSDQNPLQLAGNFVLIDPLTASWNVDSIDMTGLTETTGNQEGIAGVLLFLKNVSGTYNATLRHNQTPSGNGRRIITTTGNNVVLGPDEWAVLWGSAGYNDEQSFTGVWLVVGQSRLDYGTEIQYTAGTTLTGANNLYEQRTLYYTDSAVPAGNAYTGADDTFSKSQLVYINTNATTVSMDEAGATSGAQFLNPWGLDLSVKQKFSAVYTYLANEGKYVLTGGTAAAEYVKDTLEAQIAALDLGISIVKGDASNLTGISELHFGADTTTFDGFDITNPSAGVARVEIRDASGTDRGLITPNAQIIGGSKTFVAPAVFFDSDPGFYMANDSGYKTVIMYGSSSVSSASDNALYCLISNDTTDEFSGAGSTSVDESVGWYMEYDGSGSANGPAFYLRAYDNNLTAFQAVAFGVFDTTGTRRIGIAGTHSVPTSITTYGGIVTAVTTVTPAADNTYAYPSSITIEDGVVTAITAGGYSVDSKYAVYTERFTIDYTDLSAAATTEDVVLTTFGGNPVFIQDVVTKHTVQWAGTALLDLTATARHEETGGTLIEGITSGTQNIDVAVGNSAFEFGSGSSPRFQGNRLVIRFASSAGNMDDLTAGQLMVWVRWTVLLTS